MANLYKSSDIQRALGVSRQTLWYWRKIQLVLPVDKAHSTYLYDFPGLLAIKLVLELKRRGISTYRMKKIVANLRREIKGFKEPVLAKAPIKLDGKKIFLKLGDFTYDVETLQGCLFTKDQPEVKIYELMPSNKKRNDQLEKCKKEMLSNAG